MGFQECPVSANLGWEHAGLESFIMEKVEMQPAGPERGCPIGALHLIGLHILGVKILYHTHMQIWRVLIICSSTQ